MPQHLLRRDGDTAEVSTTGGRLVGYAVAGRELLAGEEHADRFAYRGALLAPWPNRVAGGRWTWRGRELSLPVNDPGTGAALHGLVFDVEWTVEESGEAAIALRYDLAPQPGYPFALELRASYQLRGDGLACSLTATNTGTEPAPVGLGVHPYVAAQGPLDDLVVTIPASTLLQTDDAWREIGRRDVAETDSDFRTPRRLGGQQLDTAFTDVSHDAEGRTEASVGRPDGTQVVVSSGPTCRWWVVYTGDTLPPPDSRRSLAVEPMTCPPNAFNSGEIDVLDPGGSLTLDWGFRLRDGVG